MTSNVMRMYAVGLMTFILFLSTLAGLPVLPELSASLGAGPTWIPIIVSAALATIVIAQLFTGTLADRYSRRALIVAGALIGSVSSLLCVVATHWVHLLLLRVLGGMADAIAMPALLSITASLGKDQPGKFFGILRGSQGLSYVLGPALGSALSLISLRAPFLLDGCLSLLALIAAIALVTDARPGEDVGGHAAGLPSRLRATFADRRVYLYLLMGIAGLFAFGVFYSFVPAKARLLGLEAWRIGLILSGGAVVFSVVSYSVGPLSDRIGRRIFVLVSQLLIMIGGVGLAVSRGFVPLFAFYLLFVVGEAATYLLCFVYATEAFDQRRIGASLGVFDSAMDLSLFLAPLLGAAVYGATGHMTPVFLIAVIPAAATLCVVGSRLDAGRAEQAGTDPPSG